ncbi:MerR family transcriptional regulator [Bacteroidales bacterium OttesenSCG-928-L03]|nr:MerR family transcriptional regulator [Bacteroidales bacterium OttesenSCG-928-L03]
MKPFNQEKLFYSIKEVADLFQVSQPLLRYWEKEFPSIKPARTAKGTRQYRKEDVEEIRLIHYLVKERKMTIEGAKQKLKENKETVAQTGEVVTRLQGIKAELLKLKDEFDELEVEYNRILSKQ